MSKAIPIRMGGYGPQTTGFSKALKFIGDRLQAQFGDGVAIDYVWNIMDHGYKAEDILTLVEKGEMTLGYQSSSYLTDRVPELGFVDLPFLFANNDQARASMDGELGAFLARKIEERIGYRILGWFENGFRHISNRLRPVHAPADMQGMRIRSLPSQMHARTYELLGAVPLIMDLKPAIAALKKNNPQMANLLESRQGQIATVGVKYYAVDTGPNSSASGLITSSNLIHESVTQVYTLDYYAGMSIKQLEDATTMVSKPINHRRLQFPAGEAEEVRYLLNMVNESKQTIKLSTIQYLFLNGKETYTLTFSVSTSLEARYLPAFEKIARTFRYTGY